MFPLPRRRALHRPQFHNNGLDRRQRDPGRFAITRRESDRGQFATPSLRNVARTAPYMHDGRFATLEEVVAHYNPGVNRSRRSTPISRSIPRAGSACLGKIKPPSSPSSKRSPKGRKINCQRTCGRRPHLEPNKTEPFSPAPRTPAIPLFLLGAKRGTRHGTVAWRGAYLALGTRPTCTWHLALGTKSTSPWSHGSKTVFRHRFRRRLFSARQGIGDLRIPAQLVIIGPIFLRFRLEDLPAFRRRLFDLRGRPEDAVGFAEALRLAEQDGDPAAVLDAARARELTLLAAADSPERLRLGRLALVGRGRAGRGRARAPAGSSGPATSWPGSTWSSEAFGRWSGWSGRTGQPLARWHLLRATAARAALEGRFDAARESNRQARSVAEAPGDPTAAGMSYAHASHLARCCAATRAELPRRTSAARVADGPSMPLIRANERQPAAPARPPGRGVRDLGGAARRLRRHGRRLPLGGAVLHLAELAVAFEDGPAAEVLFGRLAEYGDCPGTVGVSTPPTSPARRCGSSACSPRPPAGRRRGSRLLRRAVAANLAVRGRPMAALCRLELARLLHRPATRTGGAGAGPAGGRGVPPAGHAGPAGPGRPAGAELAAARRHADPLTAREREVATWSCGR